MAFRDIVDNQANAGPVLDGNVIPRDPFDPDAPAQSASVPMIIGTCLNDFGFTITDTSDDDHRSANGWRTSFGLSKQRAKRRKLSPCTANTIHGEMGSCSRDSGVGPSVRRSAVTQAERKAAQGAASVYMYRWDWPAYGEGAHWGAVHGTDLSPAFANPTTAMTGNSEGGKRLALQLGSAFAAFARTGNPNNSTIQPGTRTTRLSGR